MAVAAILDLFET